MKMLMMMSFSISVLLTSSAHPMIMITLISAQALIVCLTLWVTLSNAWFSFILFLVFMGGLMVLFIYVSSLASNEKIFLGSYWSPLKVTASLSATGMFFYLYTNTQVFMETCMNTSMSMIFKIYSPNMMLITALIMMYLLLTLIIVVKVITLKEGPMRDLK